MPSNIENKILQKRKTFNGEIIYDRIYCEFEIDIEKLKKEPIKLLALRHLLIAIKTTRNYQVFQGKILRKYPNEKTNNDWYSGFDFNIEVGLLFPKIYQKIYMNTDLKVDLMDLFEFITDNIDFNKIFENDRKKIKKIKDSGFYSNCG